MRALLISSLILIVLIAGCASTTVKTGSLVKPQTELPTDTKTQSGVSVAINHQETPNSGIAQEEKINTIAKADVIPASQNNQTQPTQSQPRLYNVAVSEGIGVSTKN